MVCGITTVQTGRGSKQLPRPSTQVKGEPQPPLAQASWEGVWEMPRLLHPHRQVGRQPKALGKRCLFLGHTHNLITLLPQSCSNSLTFQGKKDLYCFAWFILGI